MNESIDAGAVIAALQQTIANQALEIAKAQVVLDSRNQTIAAQQAVIQEYEAQGIEARNTHVEAARG